MLLLQSWLLPGPRLAWVTRQLSTKTRFIHGDKIEVLGKQYTADHMTNVTPHLLSHTGRDLHLHPHHPLKHVAQCVIQYMYGRYTSQRGNPLFSVHSQLHPVVTTQQNFDSLLIPKDHVSRKKSDNFYINETHLLRAHTSAHQSELISMGLDNFIVIGDVYRRDEIDSSHYPVFHQLEAVRLCTAKEMYGTHQNMGEFCLFENGKGEKKYQDVHTLESAQRMEADLKSCLQGLATTLFGQGVETRWVDAYFPFTHPSWELEVQLNGVWTELLGCGIMEQEILVNAGVKDKIGWAFGLGLERWAMKLYGIPDIRLFWSTDSGFLSQFQFDDPATNVTYRPVSRYKQCANDISFWLPKDREYDPADFYDLVRSVGGSLVEQVNLIDSFTHPKKDLKSHCYRIVYRHMERVLTQEEVNLVHQRIEKEAASSLGVSVR